MATDLSTYSGLAAVASMEARIDALGWRELMMDVASAPKTRRVERMKQLAAQGVASYGTIRRRFYAYLKNGDAALIDRRSVRPMTAANPWLECYMTYVENDLNTSANGWRKMMADFRSGRPMAGSVGTWREVWAAEHPGEKTPESCPLDWIPHGATYANLQAVAKSNPDYYFNLFAARRGRKAAGAYLLPVLKTRAGLPVLACVEYDDVWHNTDVMFGAKAVQPLEFAGYDVASGYKCSSIVKPRFERADGRRDNLKEQQFRFLFAYDHMVRGFHKGGIDDIVEHGTTAIRERVEKQIKAIPGVGDLIRIRRSGILSEQAHAGLFIGNGGGNFKMKALCEGAHNILHNRTAALPGSRGRDAAHLHESEPALVKYEERLMAAASKLPEEFALKLRCGLLSFDEYLAAFREIEHSLMSDPEHRLEGWDSNTVAEWRLSSSSNDWHAFEELKEMDATERAAIAAVVGRDARLRRVRPMSRLEAYRAGLKSGETIKVDDWYAPHFFDLEKDAMEAVVRRNGLIGFRSEMWYGRDEMLYRAVVKNRAGWEQAMSPGQKIWLLANPLMPEKIWLVSKEDGRTLGTCRLYNRAPAYDRHAIEVAMGEQAADLAAKVLPMRGRHQAEAEERAARMAGNLRVIKEAAEAAARPVAAGAGEGYSLEELTEAEDGGAGAPCAPDDDNADALSFLDQMNAV